MLHKSHRGNRVWNIPLLAEDIREILLELQIFGPVGCLHKWTWIKPNKKPITCIWSFFFAPKLEFIITVVYYVERSSRFVGGSKVDILKVLLCANIKTTHSFIHHFPLYLSFCPYFFCFSWTRVRWRWRRTSGVSAAWLLGTHAASAVAVRGGAMTQQDTGPYFDTVALLLFFFFCLRSGSRRPPRRWAVPLASCRTGLSNWQPSCSCNTTEWNSSHNDHAIVDP